MTGNSEKPEERAENEGAGSARERKVAGKPKISEEKIVKMKQKADVIKERARELLEKTLGKDQIQKPTEPEPEPEPEPEKEDLPAEKLPEKEGLVTEIDPDHQRRIKESAEGSESIEGRLKEGKFADSKDEKLSSAKVSPQKAEKAEHTRWVRQESDSEDPLPPQNRPRYDASFGGEEIKGYFTEAKRKLQAAIKRIQEKQKEITEKKKKIREELRGKSSREKNESEKESAPKENTEVPAEPAQKQIESEEKEKPEDPPKPHRPKDGWEKMKFSQLQLAKFIEVLQWRNVLDSQKRVSTQKSFEQTLPKIGLPLASRFVANVFLLLSSRKAMRRFNLI